MAWVPCSGTWVFPGLGFSGALFWVRCILCCSTHERHAIYMRNLWKIVQTQHVSQGALLAAFWREALQMRGKEHCSPRPGASSCIRGEQCGRGVRRTGVRPSRRVFRAPYVPSLPGRGGSSLPRRQPSQTSWSPGETHEELLSFPQESEEVGCDYSANIWGKFPFYE